MSVEKFKKRLEDFNDRSEIIENLFRCQEEQFASPYWLGEAVKSLAGLHDLVEDLINHMEKEKL
jgi:hypothetical protein